MKFANKKLERQLLNYKFPSVKKYHSWKIEKGDKTLEQPDLPNALAIAVIQFKK